MFQSKKSSSRRAEIRKNRPDTTEKWLARVRAEGKLSSLWIAAAFCVAAALISLMRENVVQFRPGQWAPHDIVSRVEFSYADRDQLVRIQDQRRLATPHVYRTDGNVWSELEDYLKSLPQRVTGSAYSQLSDKLKNALDQTTLGILQEYASTDRAKAWNEAVHNYVQGIESLHLVLLPQVQRNKELGRQITLESEGIQLNSDETYAPPPYMREELAVKFHPLAIKNFPLALQPQLVKITLDQLENKPTHTLDDAETTQAQNLAASRVPESEARVTVPANHKFVGKGDIDSKDYQLLKAENDAYLASLGPSLTWQRLGLAACVILITAGLSAYTARFQPRVIRNHARATAIAVLLTMTLLLAELAANGSSSLFIFGIAPTILVAMILSIAYDQRFAVGIGSIHAVLVTMAINAPLSFLLIVLSGVATCCLLLDDVRTRSKLVEVGGASALAMMIATAITGLVSFDPAHFILLNSLYAGAAGLAVGFVVLGILPFIEKAFRITTSMTLLELADASHPLLRRLSMEAPGTYNHSLQVATLAEEAAESIGANALLCRVASYYHDVGKINKAEYFVENQIDGMNRHINLDPNLSFIIIMGHVKDGIELAREYKLPTSLFPFIQQHHGTTLVEYFYHRACTQHEQREPDGAGVPDTQYRYPGPKPKSKEIAILMLADAVESATRAMVEPTTSRIESLVHELAMKRLLDRQFEECDLTMRDMERIERSLIKTLLGIYHGRIAYPSTMGTTGLTTGSASGEGPTTISSSQSTRTA